MRRALIALAALSSAFLCFSSASLGESGSWCRNHREDRYVPFLQYRYWGQCGDYMKRAHRDEYIQWHNRHYYRDWRDNHFRDGKFDDDFNHRYGGMER